MKKVLIATCILSMTMATSVMAADTFTGSLIEAQQKKIDAQTNKVVNKEKQLRQQQQMLLNPVSSKQSQIDAQKKAQEDLINKKKQQLQTQKDLLNQQKNEIKSLFSVQ